MIAHGFTIPDMVALVRAGLATANAERIVAGSRKFEVARVRITDAGRKTLREGEAMRSSMTSISPKQIDTSPSARNRSRASDW